MAKLVDTSRPPVMGVTHMVSAGHYLAAAGGYRILEEGGNAIDAGVASGLGLNVTYPHWTSLGGVAPIIVYHAASDSVVTISGLGRWPRSVTLEGFVKRYGEHPPDGIPWTVVPAAADAWLTALEMFGAMSFEQVAQPALELAENGFPVSAILHRTMGADREALKWPSTMKVVMPAGRAPEVGEPLVQRDLARTFRRLIEVERGSAHLGRQAGIRAARDFFYKGEMAEEMARFCQEQGGHLTVEDLKEFSVEVGRPEVGRYKGYTVYTCGPWCQGPVLAETLHILEGDDLAGLGHNTVGYIHLVSQALNLAFADRHHFYGDPDFVDVPMEGLLSKGFARARRGAIDMGRAFAEMPAPGDPWAYQGRPASTVRGRRPSPLRGVSRPDTSYTCAVDRWGNAFSATPSDGFATSPLVPGLGFALSARGSQTWLEPGHPCSLQPWMRPRLTPSPALAFKDGRLLMPFGSPGGDAQPQAMLQAFLNIAEFGMDPQEAVEAPRFVSLSFPDSFWPHRYLPARIKVETRVPAQTRAELSRRGHDVRDVEGWVPAGMGGVALVQVDHERGVLMAGADPRRDTYAIGR